MPVEIIGASADVPIAGDVFRAFEDDQKARQVAEERLQRRVEKERNSSSAMSLDDLARQIEQGEVKDVNIIIKADVQGKCGSGQGEHGTSGCAGHPRQCHPVRRLVRSTESGIMLAELSDADHLRVSTSVPNAMCAHRKAEEEGVDNRSAQHHLQGTGMKSSLP